MTESKTFSAYLSNVDGTRSKLAVPRSAMQFAEGDVAVTERVEGEPQRFAMQATSGQPFKHGFWGTFAVDLGGVSIQSERMAALRDHDPGQIVGYAEVFELSPDGGLSVTGTLTDKTDAGREVIALGEEGFPWQASVYLADAEVEYVDKGETAEVNGHVLSGPGAIFRKSHLREVTFTAIGADVNTSAETLSGAPPVDVEVTMTDVSTREDRAESREQDRPDEDATRFAVEAERSRCEEILSAVGSDQIELALEHVKSGSPLAVALSAICSDFKERTDERLQAARQEGEKSALLGSMQEEAPESLGNDEVVPDAQLSDEDAWAKLSKDDRLEYDNSFEFFEYCRKTGGDE